MHIKQMMRCEGGGFEDEEASPPGVLAKGAAAQSVFNLTSRG